MLPEKKKRSHFLPTPCVIAQVSVHPPPPLQLVHCFVFGFLNRTIHVVFLPVSPATRVSFLGVPSLLYFIHCTP